MTSQRITKVIAVHPFEVPGSLEQTYGNAIVVDAFLSEPEMFCGTTGDVYL